MWKNCGISFWNCTLQGISLKLLFRLTHLFSVNEPHELGRRFGPPRRAVHPYRVTDLVPWTPACDPRTFFRQSYNTALSWNNERSTPNLLTLVEMARCISTGSDCFRILIPYHFFFLFIPLPLYPVEVLLKQLTVAEFVKQFVKQDFLPSSGASENTSVTHTVTLIYIYIYIYVVFE
jgi:hypothetical protein